MTENKTNLSLQVLILNDLLHSNVIDKNIYDMALQKLGATSSQSPAA